MCKCEARQERGHKLHVGIEGLIPHNERWSRFSLGGLGGGSTAWLPIQANSLTTCGFPQNSSSYIVYKPQSIQVPPLLALLPTMLKILQPDPPNCMLISVPPDYPTTHTTVVPTLFNKISLNLAPVLSGYVLWERWEMDPILTCLKTHFYSTAV